MMNMMLKLHKVESCPDGKSQFLYVCLICSLFSLSPSPVQYLTWSCTVMFMWREKEAICQLEGTVLELSAPSCGGDCPMCLCQWTTVHKTLALVFSLPLSCFGFQKARLRQETRALFLCRGRLWNRVNLSFFFLFFLWHTQVISSAVAILVSW